MIEIREARYFLAVAQTLHFGKAAEQLGMSQPPLSQAIRQLERRLGVTLFERNNRSVALTAAGSVFVEECRTVVVSVQRAEEAVRQAGAGFVGTLRLGVITSALGDPLQRTIAAFRRSRPQVELKVVRTDTQEAGERLLQREIDVAIALLDTPIRHLRQQHWHTDHLVIALPGGHPYMADATESVDLARFADDAWVWLPREVAPHHVDQMIAICRSAGFTPTVHHIADSFMTQVAMVACGLGVALVPDVLARFIPEPAAYRRISGPAGVFHLALVTRDSDHEPLVREFMRIARAAIPDK